MGTSVSPLARAGTAADTRLQARSRQRARIAEAALGLLFVAPVAVVVFAFQLLPVLYGFFLSMQDGVNVPEGFVGLDHFIQAIGSVAYILALAVAVILALVGWQRYEHLRAVMLDGKGSFYPYLAPAFVAAVGLLLAIFLALAGFAQLAALPVVVVLLSGAWFQWLQSQRDLPPTDRLSYVVNSLLVAVFTLSAVLLGWFTFSELHRRAQPMYDLISRAVTDARYTYVEPLLPQILALVGAGAALAAVFAISAVRGKLDPDAARGARGWWGLLRGLLIVSMAGFLLYILGVQDILRVTLEQLAKVSPDQLRQVTRFRLPRIVDTATEWQQVYISVIGAAFVLLAGIVWANARLRQTTLGMVGMLFVAICLLAGGWLFVGELPVALAKGDTTFYQSLIRTVIYAGLTVPIQLSIGLLLAYLLYYEVTWGKSVFRLIYFIPYIAPTVATATVFAMIFSSSERTGPINLFMQSLGLPPQEWLRNPKGVFQLVAEFLGGPQTRLPEFMHGPALPLLSAIVYGIWVFSGYNAVIFMAGFGNVPRDIYEAAAVDGAGRWQTFRQIIFPMISPTTFFLSLLAIIGTFRAFTHLWVLRQDDRGAMDTTVVYIYETILQASSLKTRPYAAAMSFLLFGVILILTLVQNRLSKDRVFYG